MKNKDRFKVSVCPDTYKVFVVQVGRDDKLCEVFDWRGGSAITNANVVVYRLNAAASLRELKLVLEDELTALNCWSQSRLALPPDVDQGIAISTDKIKHALKLLKGLK